MPLKQRNNTKQRINTGKEGGMQEKERQTDSDRERKRKKWKAREKN